MQRQLTWRSGRTVPIPANIAQALAAAEADEEASLVSETAQEVEDVLHDLVSRRDLQSASKIALAAAAGYLKNQNPEAAALCLCTYTSSQARILQEQDHSGQGLDLLLECAELLQATLAATNPTWARILSRELSECVQAGMSFCAISKLDDLLSSETNVARMFEVARTVWGPGVEDQITQLMEALHALVIGLQKNKNKKNRLSLLRKMSSQLTSIKASLQQKAATNSAEARKRAGIFGNTIDSWREAIQDEIVQLAATEYQQEGATSQQAYPASWVDDVRTSIEAVERRLRHLIADRYLSQFGDGWVQHVQAKHRGMYEIWVSTAQKDKAAFQLYQQYQPGILEYARFGDLVELICAQWHLFKDTLDFGADKRNKNEFHDRMKAIERVRNPLAHHRAVPENELLRALVFCRDILLILDQSTGRGE